MLFIIIVISLFSTIIVKMNYTR